MRDVAGRAAPGRDKRKKLGKPTVLMRGKSGATWDLGSDAGRKRGAIRSLQKWTVGVPKTKVAFRFPQRSILSRVSIIRRASAFGPPQNCPAGQIRKQFPEPTLQSKTSCHPNHPDPRRSCLAGRRHDGGHANVVLWVLGSCKSCAPRTRKDVAVYSESQRQPSCRCSALVRWAALTPQRTSSIVYCIHETHDPSRNRMGFGEKGIYLIPPDDQLVRFKWICLLQFAMVSCIRD
jgi:hypothetical protein